MNIAIPVIAAVLLGLLCLPRLRKDPRGPAAGPERGAVTGPRACAPATRPFAYDNGLMTGPREEEAP